MKLELEKIEDYRFRNEIFTDFVKEFLKKKKGSLFLREYSCGYNAFNYFIEVRDTGFLWFPGHIVAEIDNLTIHMKDITWRSDLEQIARTWELRHPNKEITIKGLVP